MLKDYWYVLVPVHVATSAVWFGGFYVMCKSGVDVGSLLQFFGASDAYIEKLSNSSMGYAALAYGCYKLATPARWEMYFYQVFQQVLDRNLAKKSQNSEMAKKLVKVCLHSS